MKEVITLPHDWFPNPVPSNVAIGPRSWVHSSYAFLHCRSLRPQAVRIGCDSGIYRGTFFELGPAGEVEVGDFCTVVGAIIRTDRRVIIEDYALISHEVVISDSIAPIPPPISAAAALESPGISVIVRRNAWIAANAILLAGADVGEGAIVGAGAVVDFAVPEFAIVAGNPARIVGSARPRVEQS